MITPHRVTAKLMVTDPTTFEPHQFTPIFHRWIRETAVPGMLVDVADYQHVTDGPSVLLIGHDIDYGLDSTGGRTGLIVRRKRQGELDLATQLADALRYLLQAAEILEADEAIDIAFERGEVEVQIVDRLKVENTAEAFAALRGEFEKAAADIFEGAAVERVEGDPRAPMTVRITAAAVAAS